MSYVMDSTPLVNKYVLYSKSKGRLALCRGSGKPLDDLGLQH